MFKTQKNALQTPLFIVGLGLGLISSLTGCGHGGHCGSGFEWPWEPDVADPNDPQPPDLPGTFAQYANDPSVLLDDLEMEVPNTEMVVMTYFVTDSNGQDRLVEATFEVTDIYEGF